MRISIVPAGDKIGTLVKHSFAALALSVLSAATLSAAPSDEAAGEANLRLPDLSSVSFLGVDGHTLLLYGIFVCILGLLFGMWIFTRLKTCRCIAPCARYPS